MSSKTVIVLDCGATNVRAVAVDEDGRIAAIHSTGNRTGPDPAWKGGLIWDTEEIWQKFCRCAHALRDKIDVNNISAITVTTFGVNGAPVDRDGNLLYPVISWQCQRTVPVMENIDKYIPLDELYSITGVNSFSFNTINTLIWLKENKPDIIEEMAGFLFISSLFIHKLTGELVNDATMAGTSMLTDIGTRSFSTEILRRTNLPNRFFTLGEAGEVVGKLTRKASRELGLPEGIPVSLAGHDTQFALIGSGAGENEAVLSSGTWEILMTRSRNTDLSRETLKAGVTNEYDATPGLYNTGIQWLASGVLEWIRKQFYYAESGANPDNIYDVMINDASRSDSPDIRFNIDLTEYHGAISGIGINTSRGEIYRAALEAITERTRESLAFLQKTGRFTAESIIVVGGGAKNGLWNQMRADKLGIPVKLPGQTETTVLGAALFALVATGTFASVDEAIEAICRNYKYVYPH